MNLETKLLNQIKADPNVKRYQVIEPIINKNPHLKGLLAKLKHTQQQLVNAKHLKKTQLIISLEEQYQTILNEINDTPLIQEYLDLQTYINQLLTTITNILETTINENIER